MTTGSLEDWAERIETEAKARGISSAQMFSLDSIARCALECQGEGDQMWVKGISLSGAPQATIRALTKKGFLSPDGGLTELGISTAQESYGIVTGRDWHQDLKL